MMCDEFACVTGPHTEDIFEQLVIASEKVHHIIITRITSSHTQSQRIFLELAVPTILALLSARPAFVPVVQVYNDDVIHAMMT